MIYSLAANNLLYLM